MLVQSLRAFLVLVFAIGAGTDLSFADMRIMVAESVAPTPAPAVAADGSQRAMLIEEDPFDPKGKQDAGSVIWRTGTLEPAGGVKSDIAVRADIEIPDRDFKMTMLFRRNTDASLPASHTIELIFALPPDFAGGGIANVPGITMKLGEQSVGERLSGVVVKVSDSFFMMGLSNEALDRNLTLLKERSWFDITLFYVSGRRAILAVEKGAAGEQAFADAISAWAAGQK
jgi:hypothetical protein